MKKTNNSEIGSAVLFYGLIPLAIAATLVWIDVPRAVTSRETLFGLATGLFAVVGFLATARSFLVIKLHEAVYGTDGYIARIRGIVGEHASVYDHLKVFDQAMGSCIVTGALGTALLWVAAFMPACWFAVEIAFAFFIVTIARFLYLAWRMNVNFQAMIEEWDEAAKKRMREIRRPGDPDNCTMKERCPFYRPPSPPKA